ncbi:hypothetical protein G7K_5422-t1 [Saitoella complicata NRRL Y-17804]|uniref:Uncharacterized protein n=1 Tax=Saitoella complicata (strain BCRC 22490 / CBS 7301 / JCM 7358 / NBRC 10748 / NRRL Y-17804) TaxID=698492 RepID=A0A0E9NNC3_SAICN|nr:hypothetical protein G7K_5422-t1 [Saitoella complicata NRRL Y-17804]
MNELSDPAGRSGRPRPKKKVRCFIKTGKGTWTSSGTEWLFAFRYSPSQGHIQKRSNPTPIFPSTTTSR